MKEKYNYTAFKHILKQSFFHIVYFDFCIESLEDLEKIAQHNGLCPSVRELRVGEHWSCNNDDCRARRTDHRLGQGYKCMRGSSGCIDVDDPKVVNSFRRALTESLSKCRAISMRQGSHERQREKGSVTLPSMTDATHIHYTL